MIPGRKRNGNKTVNLKIGLSDIVVNVKPPYDNIVLDDTVILYDHLNGFDRDGNNPILQKLSDMCNGRKILASYHQILPSHVLQKYPNLDIRFDALNQIDQIEMHFTSDYNVDITSNLPPTNFLMTLMGNPYAGRWLLCAALDKADWLNLDYSSKNIGFDINVVDGFIRNNVSTDEEPYYFNRLVNLERRQFYLDVQHDNSFRANVAVPTTNRMFDLLPKIEKTFLQLVSESIPESYVPFISEKFLYSILPERLFLAYAQPGWHASLKNNYGFKLYDGIFDYSFDEVLNPVKRLDTLLNTIRPYSNMTPDEWMDIYKLTKDTREFNKHHFLSGDCYKTIQKFNNW